MTQGNEHAGVKSAEEIPHISYRLYKSEERVTIVLILNEDESLFDPSRFVSKPFYTQSGIELASLGYKLLDGEWLMFEERTKLARLLR